MDPRILLPGTSRPTLDHRDRDFLKSFKFAGTGRPVFPDDYDTDAHLWTPNQNIVNPEFPNTPAEPFGCTNYTSSDLAADLDGKLHDPGVLEAITHANALGGYQLRDSLMAAKRIGLITGFYNVKAYAPLDYFDAFRLAMFSGLPEKRSLSIGTPWYNEFNAASNGSIQMSDGTWQLRAGQVANPIVRMPANLNDPGVGWHNWKGAGWKTINGSPYIKGKPWMGKEAGDNGYLYFGRDVINAVMTLKFTIAFTATHTTPTSIYKVDMAQFDKFTSILRNLIGLRY